MLNQCKRCATRFQGDEKYCPACGVDAWSLPFVAEGELMLKDSLELEFYIYDTNKLRNHFIEEELDEFVGKKIYFWFRSGDVIISTSGTLTKVENDFIINDRLSIGSILFYSTGQPVALKVYRYSSKALQNN